MVLALRVYEVFITTCLSADYILKGAGGYVNFAGASRKIGFDQSVA
jgi:hypothetical protein